MTVTAPSRRPVIARVLDVAERPGVYRIEFTPEEVGTHLIDVSLKYSQKPNNLFLKFFRIIIGTALKNTSTYL